MAYDSEWATKEWERFAGENVCFYPCEYLDFADAMIKQREA